MTGISGLGPTGGPLPAARARRGPAFSVPEEDVQAERAASPGRVAMPSLLALQEAEQEPVQDREAKRHGRSMLDVLGRLQRALLGAGQGADALEALASLVRAAPMPADPALAAVQQALLVRAAVELQRGRMEAAARERAGAAASA